MTLAVPAHAADRSRIKPLPPLQSHIPVMPSIPPTVSIPVDPLGFAPPGPLYLGQRNTMASLDFIGEDKLLFTFRVPGLLHRDPNDDGESDEREIRALVLDLPTAAVEDQALWTVHDRSRYLWMLANGQFLLRNRDTLYAGDPTLTLRPWLRFPGRIRWMELDPSQQIVVTDSLEPSAATTRSNTAPDPSSDSQSSGQQDIVLRIVKRVTSSILLVTRVHAPVHLALNAQGYLEAMRGSAGQWTLSLDYFSSGRQIIGTVDSTCEPDRQFLSPITFLVSACQPDGSSNLVAFTTDGTRLWQRSAAPESIWPLLTVSPDGSRFARETLSSTHAVSAFQPLSTSDIQGQIVQVLDTATGKQVLDVPASPILDAGGNVAFSPSGRRIAVLNAGAIQVFDLPAAPPLPAASPNH